MPVSLNTNALTARRAALIAQEYGYRLRSLREELIEARKLHGSVVKGTDGVTRTYRAVDLFRSWVQDIAYEAKCDSLAARAFEDAAYGRGY